MIASFGIEKNEIARWAGFTGAIFSASQSLTAVAWGRASDRFGRKPVILVCLASTMVCFLLWGMSTSLTMAITVRAIMGGCNGNVGIIRTVVAELVPERELQPTAFSLMPLVWSIGSVFGPAFGGFFARPAEQYPNLFGHIEYFKRYPFALPNLMACCVFFISFMTGLLFLKETLQSKRHMPDWGLALGEKLARPFKRSRSLVKRRRLSFVDDEASAPLLAQSAMSSSDHIASRTEPVSLRDIFTPQTSINLLAYTLLALHTVAYDQVLTVFLNYPRVVPDENNTHLPFRFTGGFGLSSDKIGTIFTLYGVGCGVVQFFLFPTLCARFGVLNCYRAATLVFPFIYLVTPYTALIQATVPRYAVFLTMMLVKGFVVIIGFPCTTILLTNSASSLHTLGTLNGIATTFSGLGRAVGPATVGAVFSLGVRRGYAIAPWWLLAAIAMLGAVPGWFIVEGEGPTRSLAAAVDDEGEEQEEESLLRDAVGSDDEGDEDVAILEAVDGESDSGLEPPRKKGNKTYGTMNGAST